MAGCSESKTHLNLANTLNPHLSQLHQKLQATYNFFSIEKNLCHSQFNTNLVVMCISCWIGQNIEHIFGHMLTGKQVNNADS